MKKLLCAVLVTAIGGAAVRGDETPPAMRILVQALGKAETPETQRNILRGINAALKGKRNLPAPAGWDALYSKLAASPDAEIRQQAQALAATFGAGAALDDLRKILGDPRAPTERRAAALDSLVAARDGAALPSILTLLGAAGPLRTAALHALASFNDSRIPPALLAAFPSFTQEEKREALSTLVTRPAWAREIIRGLDARVIRRSEVSTPLARQLRELNDPAITEWLGLNWGALRSSPADKQQQIARLKAVLTPEFMAAGNPSHGRALFSQTCALCHTLFGVGAKIGPELPGAFSDLDYLLLNIIDPNAIIGKDYQQTVIQTKDGQTLTGIIAEQDGSSVTLKSLAGTQTVQRADIASLTVLDTSLMPEGLLSTLKDEDVRDLFSYLALHGQVPILATRANVTDFFNSSDLSHWISSRPDAWRVENGEIIGRGNEDRPETLTSDFLLKDFHLKAKVKITGPDADAGIRFQNPGIGADFLGSALRFRNDYVSRVSYSTEVTQTVGGPMTRSEYRREPVEIGIDCRMGRSVISLNGHNMFDGTVEGEGNSVIAFRISGAGAEMHITELHVELADPSAPALPLKTESK